MENFNVRKLKGDPEARKPRMFFRPLRSFPGMFRFTCCREVMVFRGDVWPCLTCGRVHQIPRTERKY